MQNIFRSISMKKIHFYNNSFFSYTSSKEILLFIIGEISVAVQLALSIYLLKNQFNWSGIVGAYLSLIICSIVLATICFLLISLANKNHMLKTRNEISRNLLESQRKYYAMLLKNEEQTKAFRHDIRNHLYCMKTLFDNGDFESLGDYFNKFNIALKDLDTGIHTGNNLIDVILNDISGSYINTKIKWTGSLDKNLKIAQPDLCTIFSNLLSNAFESADKCENKMVQVGIKSLGSNLLINVSNTASSKPYVVNNEIVTSKKEKGHGYGIKNIKICLKKYNGSLNFAYENGIFTAEIILPDAIEILL